MNARVDTADPNQEKMRDALKFLLEGKKITGVAVNVTPATPYARTMIAVNIRVDGASFTFLVLDPSHLIAEATG